MGYIDLHVHSNKSDGTYSVSELVCYAAKKGLTAFALTDHDTVEGVSEALEEAKKYNIKVIPGIEMSSYYNGVDLHILGLNIDYKNQEFITFIDTCKENRRLRNIKMAEKLKNAGIDISIEKIYELYGNVSITRAHFARFLVDKGYVKNKEEAFQKYLREGGTAYVPKVTVSPKETIGIIKKAGGHPVLAHPLLYKYTREQLNSLFDYLKSFGLEGIEGIYSLNTPQQDAMLEKMAKAHGLYITGGSDFHGSNKPDIDLGTGRGNLKIEEKILENIR